MLTAILIATLLAPPAAQPQPSALLHERYTLDNGLEVVLHEDHRIPFIAVRLVYHVGTMHDPPGKEGLTHLLEHAMFGGSAHVADGEHYEKLLRAGASGVGAFTTQSSTVYHADIPANRLPLVLWLESDRMGTFNARTHRGTIEKERRIVVEEMAQRRR
ncbi:MAG: insulinase family protein, partial [Deltaproteobacteria bacterium]|nr:insulinase family protein [Nannocystaceae bacterium]